MEESLLPDIETYCARFETQAYASLADRYLDFLFKENKKFRGSVESRDRRIIELLRENGELRKKGTK